ncbi:hypothetical protein JAAARDRAFT_110350, partial [Jaapia argillacea MUCL 33604]
VGGQQCEARTNAEKSKTLARSFFPPKPTTPSVPTNHTYPPPINYTSTVTQEQITCMIGKLKPYKAAGPDEVSNSVLINCLDILVDYLYFIFSAIPRLNAYYDGWLEWITAVLRKVGQSRYDLAKSFRPIALLCMFGKLFTGMLAEDVVFVCESMNFFLPTT